MLSAKQNTKQLCFQTGQDLRRTHQSGAGGRISGPIDILRVGAVGPRVVKGSEASRSESSKTAKRSETKRDFENMKGSEAKR